LGAWGRRRVTAGDPARGGGALGSPEHANPAFPGSNWHGVWPRMDYAPCVVHLGSSWIVGSPGVGKARATAALRTAARRRSAFWLGKDRRVSTTSAKGGEEGTDAHLGGLGEQGGREGRRRCGPAARSGRRSGWRLLQGLLGLWKSWFEAGAPVRDTRGVRIAGGTPAARNCHGGRELTSGGAEAIRAERRPEVERGVLRWLPGAEAELMRRFAGAWGRWSGESAAAQCSAPPPEARRRGLGFWGGGGVEMRTREAAGAFIRRRPP